METMTVTAALRPGPEMWEAAAIGPAEVAGLGAIGADPTLACAGLAALIFAGVWRRPGDRRRLDSVDIVAALHASYRLEGSQRVVRA